MNQAQHHLNSHSNSIKDYYTYYYIDEEIEAYP